jgi:urease accessory protein
MTELNRLMTVLQYGDSFFPSGAVSFSWGLEGLAEQGRLADAADIEAFVLGQLHARWASFDRAVVVAAHRAGSDLVAVARIDGQVEIQTPAAELRSASCRMGEAMLSVFARLGVADAASYRGMVKRGEACGHLAAMQGFLWAGVGLSQQEALAISAHSFSVGLLGAAVRLGHLTHIDAQRILSLVRAEIAPIAEEPAPSMDEISSFAIESEVAMMSHARRSLRLFVN